MLKLGDKISNSMIAMFRADTARFCVTYLFGVRGGTNANMARGLATEVGYDFMWQNEFCT